jgi:Cu/Ag efflux protein CusF
VVVSGQFLLDSEANLRGSAARMSEHAGNTCLTRGHLHAADHQNHRGVGTVADVDAAKRSTSKSITARSLPWTGQPCKMDFAVKDKTALARLKKGARSSSRLHGKPDRGGRLRARQNRACRRQAVIRRLISAGR